MSELSLRDIQAAAKRVSSYVCHTPIVGSQFLNRKLGHELYFKCENLQRVGAFKARGALNTLLWLQGKDQLPRKVVAYSSGNHAQAVAWAASTLGVPAEIYMPKFVSPIKLAATKGYGAQVKLFDTRKQAEQAAAAAVNDGAYLIPPYDHDQVICGQGTACLEALEELGPENIDGVFVPCGGGGLSSGTLIAAKGLNPEMVVGAGEPLQANDAARSLREGTIQSYDTSPDTIADGAKTLRVSERTFHYLKQLDHFSEASEQDIIKWTQWMVHTLKIHVEPTSALALAAAANWLKQQSEPQRVLIIVSGGNVAPETMLTVWQNNWLVKET